MTTIPSVGPSMGAFAAQPGQTVRQPGGQSTPSLMQPPMGSGTDDLTVLFGIMAQQRQLGMRQGINDIKQAQANRRLEWQKAKAALAKALKAKKKGGFFRKLARNCLKLAKVAIIAAAVATAVGTGGAAAPVAILAWSAAGMSTAAFLQGETQYLQKLGMSDKAAAWTEVGLTVGGGLAGGGASVLAQSSLANNITTGAQVAGIAAGGAGGVATWQASRYEAEELEHRADAVEANGAEQLIERMLAMMLSDLEHSDKSDQRTLDHLKSTVEAKGETLILAGKQV